MILELTLCLEPAWFSDSTRSSDQARAARSE